VLVIEPPSAAFGARTETWAQAGSFGTMAVRASDVRALGDGAVTAGTGVYASRSDGDFAFERPVPRTGSVVADERTNASHRALGAIERVAWTAPWGSVGLTLLGQAERRGLPGTALDPTRFPTLETSRVAAGLDTRLRSSATGAVHAALWGRRDTASFEDPLGELTPTRTPAAAEDAIEAVGGSLGWRGQVLAPRSGAHGSGPKRGDQPPGSGATGDDQPGDQGSLGIDVFADGRGERFVPELSRSFARGGGASRVAAGIGAEVDWRVMRQLLVTGSGRVDLRRDDASGVVGRGGVPLEVATEVAPTGHIGASLRLADGLAIAAHGGALRRPPSFVELYGDRGTLVGDAELRPERALSADVGVTGDLGLGPALFGAELVGFATHATDLIAFVPVGRSSRVARNIDSAWLGGLEASAVIATKRLSTTLGYTFLHTRNDGDDPLSRGRPLPGRPAHDLTCDVAYALGPVRARYGLDAIAGTTVDAEAAIELPARVLHGAELSVELPMPGRSQLRLGVSVENLFDLRTLHVESALGQTSVPVPVSDFLGFPLPGRAVYASARFRMDGR
jgi:vitamin B12 transporter